MSTHRTTDSPDIPYVVWRDGRPRFEPSPKLRKLGYKGQDLKAAGGRWMTAGEALDWSREITKQISAADRRKRRVKNGTEPQAPTPVQMPAATIVTFPVQRLFKDWLAELEDNLKTAEAKGEKPDITRRTFEDYESKTRIFENHAFDVWLSEVHALTKPICRGIYKSIRKKAGNASAVGGMRILGIAIQWAIDDGKIPDLHVNPAHKLKMKTPDARLRVATTEEMKVLVETADELGEEEMADNFTLAVWSGQRQADRLNFLHAGRADGRITVRQGKTSVIVSMMEAPELQKRLQAAEQRRKVAGVISPYVILDERTWTPFTADHYRRRFENIRRVAALKLPTLKTLRDQDFRDTAVTWLAMAGCTIPQICAITGHSFKTANDILKHYLALNQEMADSAIAKLIVWFDEKKEKAT